MAAGGDAALARLCLGEPEQRVNSTAHLLARSGGGSTRESRWLADRYVQAVEQIMSVLWAVGEDVEAERIRRLALELTPAQFPQVAAALTAGQMLGDPQA